VWLWGHGELKNKGDNPRARFPFFGTDSLAQGLEQRIIAAKPLIVIIYHLFRLIVFCKFIKS
jgi:hypothetical protein